MTNPQALVNMAGGPGSMSKCWAIKVIKVAWTKLERILATGLGATAARLLLKRS